MLVRRELDRGRLLFCPFYSIYSVLKGGPCMVAYEFYWRDQEGKEHFIGILPERRKNSERITEKSVLNWGWKVIGNDTEVRDIYFVRIAM